tara:strand:+ start:119 stop:751 length:633 start_codon:yes stop_codon:yes gene_type:complete
VLGILDYGMGNIFSIKNAAKNIGLESTIISNPEDLKETSSLILPGVGAYGYAMNKLRNNNLIEPILEFIDTGKYILGICLGMQLLVKKSFEFEENDGIGVLEGECIKFRNISDQKIIVPHTMWNKIKISRNKSDRIGIFDKIDDESFFYFVHSYYVQKQVIDEVISITSYNDIEFCSAFQKENVIGLQFHPEKSGKNGLQLLSNFKNMIK